MSQGHRPTAWLSQQRHVPARCEERDYPAFRPVELIDMAISDDERDFWWLVEMPGNSDNDPVGAIGFTVFGMKQDKNSEITLDLPTVCKIDPANTPTFPALLYVKDAATIDDAVLTTEEDDAIEGGPTFLSSGYYREDRDLVFVDQMLGGGTDTLFGRTIAQHPSRTIQLVDIYGNTGDTYFEETETGRQVYAGHREGTLGAGTEVILTLFPHGRNQEVDTGEGIETVDVWEMSPLTCSPEFPPTTTTTTTTPAPTTTTTPAPTTTTTPAPTTTTTPAPTTTTTPA